jgi:hypothetical protein
MREQQQGAAVQHEAGHEAGAGHAGACTQISVCTGARRKRRSGEPTGTGPPAGHD